MLVSDRVSLENDPREKNRVNHPFVHTGLLVVMCLLSYRGFSVLACTKLYEFFGTAQPFPASQWPFHFG